MAISGDSISQIANGIKTTVLNGSSAKKPYLVLASAPVVGHTTPLLKLATELSARGFEQTFIGGEEFQDAIAKTGAKPVPVPGRFQDYAAQRELIPAGIPRLVFDMNVVFVGPTAERWQLLNDVLEKLREEDPTRDVVIITEPFYMGTNPMLLGAPLPKGYTTRPKVINFCQAPYFAFSVITGPFGPALPPDDSEACIARNHLINTMMNAGPFAEPIALQTKLLKECGVDEKRVPTELLSDWYTMHDVTLQMCPPSLEYTRPDVPATVKFAGALPPNVVGPDFVYPGWWADVTRGDKRVVFVTQGTVATVYTDLLIPAVRSLADREDLLVIAVLGEKGASLPADEPVPANTRVIDYLPYDALLPHTAAFVMNAGYGGFLHGVSHGVPMVLRGDSEDKPEVAARGEWAGVAVNLRTGKPEEAAVRAAVDRVLSEPAFKKRVMAIKAENEALGAFDFVERQIMEYAA